MKTMPKNKSKGKGKESEGKKEKEAGEWNKGNKIMLIVSIGLLALAGYYWVLFIASAGFGTSYTDYLYFTQLTADMNLIWAVMFTIPAVMLLVLACAKPRFGKRK
jgi:magnesium-transporting ATPase (P-type)